MLYSRIAISLWKSSKGLGRNLQMKNTTPLTGFTTSSNAHPYCRHPAKCEKRMLNPSESEVGFKIGLNQLKFNLKIYNKNLQKGFHGVR